MQREGIAANMNRAGVIQLIGELPFALGLPHECSGCNCLAEIVEDHSGPDFLDDVIKFPGVEVSQTNRVFEFSERRFNSPAHMIQISDFLEGEVTLGKISQNALVRIVRNGEANDSGVDFVGCRRMQIKKIEMNVLRDKVILIRLGFHRLCLFSGQ